MRERAKSNAMSARWMAACCLAIALCVAAGCAVAAESRAPGAEPAAAQGAVSDKLGAEKLGSETAPVDMSADDSVVPSDMKTREDYRPAFDEDEEQGTHRVSVWRVMGSLAIVIMLILAFAYVMKMLWAKGMRLELKGRHIKVMDTVQLGLNRQLYLVSVGKRRVLLGSGEKGLTYLMEVGEDEVLDYGGESPTADGGVGFQGELERRAGEIMGGAAPIMNRLKSKLKKLEEE
jgi:flagellar biogenesis protein FliO